MAGGATAELETWSLPKKSVRLITPIHILLLPFAAKSLLRSGQY